MDGGTSVASDAGGVTSGGTPDAGNGGVADAGTGGGAVPDAGSGGGGVSDAGGGGVPDAGGGGTAQGPVQLTTGQTALSIALDDANVFWADYDNTGGWRQWHYRVHAMPKAGGTPVVIAEGAGAMLAGLTAVDGFVYWSMATCPTSCDVAEYRSLIYRVRRGGGTLEVLQVDTALTELAVDSERVYFRARQWSNPDPRAGLWSIRFDGTGARQLTIYPGGTGPVLAGGLLYYLDTGGDPDIGFWTALKVIPAAGGTATIIRSDYNSAIFPYGLALTGGTAFTSTQTGLWRLPLDGSGWDLIWAGSKLVAPDANHGHVYFSQSPYRSSPGCLGRANLDGSDARCLDQGEHQYLRVKVDDASAFFIRDGDIYRLPRQ